MTTSTEDTKVTGTQLLEQILEQISLQTDSLDGICARLDNLIEAVGSGDNQTNGQSESNGGQSNGNVIEFDASEIVTTVDDSGERKLFRIKGGQYTTYGLRVWPEVIESFGLDPEELPLGFTPFARRVRAQITDRGKKVIGLAEGSES